MRTKPELLAPAGDFEKLRFAFAYGADAVYAGLPMFSLRTRENRFDLEEVRKGIEHAHRLGRKFYLTANIYAHNSKIQPFLEAMEQVIPLGADAYIMSDPGLIDLVKERFPEIQIHLSTQANNTNWAQARFWKKLGISRVILARELNLEEIREIVARNPDLELEAFVHGAICMAYSGRCLLSDYMTGRASNSGACTQSCRWHYKPLKGIQERDCDSPPMLLNLEEEKRPGQAIPVLEDSYGTYIFNSKDLCAIELLPGLLETGLHSVKIEGRNKNFLYLATVIKCYREAIDSLIEGASGEHGFDARLPQWLAELNSINYRGYTLGFLNGVLADLTDYAKTSRATHVFAGKIAKLHAGPNRDCWAEIEIKNKISVGDEVEWVTPRHGILRHRITRIRDHQDLDLSTISPGANWNPKVFVGNLDLNEFSLMRTPTPLPEAK